MSNSNEEELSKEYFAVASNVFDNLEQDGVHVSSGLNNSVNMDPEYLDEMAAYFNEKSKEFLQSMLYLEQSTREAAQACVALAEQIRSISEYNNEQGECSD